jgi:thiol:disulfide interchange protein DsbD
MKRFPFFAAVMALLLSNASLAQTPSDSTAGPKKAPFSLSALFGGNNATPNATTNPTTNAPTNEPLPLELAFKTAATRQGSAVTVQFDIAAGYYLYREKIKILAELPVNALANNAAQAIELPLSLPAGASHYDETFQKTVAIYRQQLRVPLEAAPSASDKAVPISLIVYSQGCADIGICYPPRIQRLTFATATSPLMITDLKRDPVTQGSIQIVKVAPVAPAVLEKKKDLTPAVSLTQAVPASVATPLNSSDSAATANKPQTNSNTADTHSVAYLIQTQPMLVWLFGFVGVGLLLAFTPCVLPMMPIVSAIVLGQSSNTVRTGGQALARSAAYVFGMCASYTLLGVVAGLAGVGLGAYLQQPWVLTVFALLMVLMAGMQFGWYQLRLPDALQQRLNHLNQHNQAATSKGGYAGLILMGALAAVIVSPCVTPPLAGILLFISQTQDAFKGALALFSLSLGMGLPLLMLAVGGAKWLPKTGVWMQQLSYTFGVLLLAVAVWIVRSLVPAPLFSMACAALLILLAENFGAFQAAALQSTRASRLLKAVSWCALLWAAIIMCGLAMGSYDLLRPLAVMSASTGSGQTTSADASPSSTFKTVASGDLNAALQAGDKPYIVDIYADWCVSCVEFERFTLRDAAVNQALAGFKRLRVDVTHNTLDDQALLKQLHLFGPPAMVFYSTDGKPLNDSTRVIGFQAAEQFLSHLRRLERQRLLRP